MAVSSKVVSTSAIVQRLIAGFVFASGLLVVVLASTACAPRTPGEPTPASVAPDGTQHVTISVGNGMKFQPSAVTVRAGQPIDLTLRNEDASAHDLTLKEGVAQPVNLTANGGETTSGTATFDTPGTYTFECSIPGHALLGMRGTITVQ